MNADGNTTYTTDSSNASLSRAAFYQYQSTLSTNTTYCWKVDATDPAGAGISGLYGAPSATQLFTTAATNDRPVNINGNINIKGNVIIR